MEETKIVQMEHWIRQCISNMKEFKKDFDGKLPSNKQKKLEFIRRQYYLISLLINVLEGRTELRGANLEYIFLERLNMNR